MGVRFVRRQYMVREVQTYAVEEGTLSAPRLLDDGLMDLDDEIVNRGVLVARHTEHVDDDGLDVEIINRGQAVNEMEVSEN